jgi:hypothetical protein
MRRFLAPLLLAAVAAVASACSGADAQEAQQLLAQSDAAFADVDSVTFSATLTVTAAGQEFKMSMNGGGYAHGKHAGDVYLVATSTGMPFRELEMVERSGRVTMRVDGASVADVPVPNNADNQLELVDFTQYVKDVRIEHGKVIDGESMTKVRGVIDTAGLLNGVLGDLSGSSSAGLNLSDVLGDTHVALYLSDVTHLPMRGLVDLSMKVGDEKGEMHMDFAYTSYNEKLDFPQLT